MPGIGRVPGVHVGDRLIDGVVGGDRSTGNRLQLGPGDVSAVVVALVVVRALDIVATLSGAVRRGRNALAAEQADNRRREGVPLGSGRQDGPGAAGDGTAERDSASFGCGERGLRVRHAHVNRCACRTTVCGVAKHAAVDRRRWTVLGGAWSVMLGDEHPCPSRGGQDKGSDGR
jgi:hypothetical protein